MLAVQAGCVLAPRVPPGAQRLRRMAGRGWAVVPLASIVLVVFAIRYVNDTATGLTYLALIAVPPLAAVALGWTMRGARLVLVPLAAVLFAVAWAARGSLAGEGAAVLLSALSCITLGVLLSAVTPPTWLKVGIVLMAGADTWLVVSDLLQAPNASLIAAAPGGGLPQLQSEAFGSVSMGYGDLFIAAVLGAVLASDPRRQRLAALMTFVVAALFDLLFFAVNELPATVPVALTLIILELWDLYRRPRPRPRPVPTRTPAAPERV